MTPESEPSRCAPASVALGFLVLVLGLVGAAGFDAALSGQHWQTLLLVIALAAAVGAGTALIVWRHRLSAERDQVVLRFTTIFDASPIGIAIASLRDQRIEDVNAAMLALLGYSREQLLGQRAVEVGIWERPEERARLLEQLQQPRKAEVGRIELRPEPVPLAEVCQASLFFVKEQALKKGLQLSLHVLDHALIVDADPVRLKQMLVNLLSNAVKFTPSGGTVRLETASDPAAGVVRLVVADTGIGIAADDLPRLFQPFSQLDTRLDRRYEGSGLGLALVRRLAELHGGSCAVESEPGVGSRFTITLPYHPESREQRTENREQRAESREQPGVPIRT